MPELLAMPDLALVQRRLNSCDTTGQLFARAAEEAREFCRFTRALVLVVEHGMLVATGVDPLDDPASEVLRRTVRAAPIALPPGELVPGRRTDCDDGFLREHLGLDNVASAVVAPDGRALAFLVVDREGPVVDDADRATVELYAHLLSCALERALLRRRMRGLATELRHLVSDGSIFTTAGEFSGAGDLDALLSARERDVAALMVNGRSNRQMADVLHLSPETVKGYVGHVVRKLGAANRVDAVARYVSMRHGS